jgi:hypothetical protein
MPSVAFRSQRNVNVVRVRALFHQLDVGHWDGPGASCLDLWHRLNPLVLAFSCIHRPIHVSKNWPNHQWFEGFAALKNFGFCGVLSRDGCGLAFADGVALASGSMHSQCGFLIIHWTFQHNNLGETP